MTYPPDIPPPPPLFHGQSAEYWATEAFHAQNGLMQALAERDAALAQARARCACSTCDAQMVRLPGMWRCPVDPRHGDRMWPDGENP
jgi:hypothetical protein